MTCVMPVYTAHTSIARLEEVTIIKTVKIQRPNDAAEKPGQWSHTRWVQQQLFFSSFSPIKSPPRVAALVTPP